MIGYTVAYKLDERDVETLAGRGFCAHPGELYPAEIISGSASGPADLRVLLGEVETTTYPAPARMPGEADGQWHLRIGA